MFASMIAKRGAEPPTDDLEVHSGQPKVTHLGKKHLLCDFDKVNVHINDARALFFSLRHKQYLSF